MSFIPIPKSWSMIPLLMKQNPGLHPRPPYFKTDETFFCLLCDSEFFFDTYIPGIEPYKWEGLCSYECRDQVKWCYKCCQFLVYDYYGDDKNNCPHCEDFICHSCDNENVDGFNNHEEICPGNSTHMRKRCGRGGCDRCLCDGFHNGVPCTKVAHNKGLKCKACCKKFCKSLRKKVRS